MMDIAPVAKLLRIFCYDGAAGPGFFRLNETPTGESVSLLFCEAILHSKFTGSAGAQRFLRSFGVTSSLVGLTGVSPLTRSLGSKLMMHSVFGTPLWGSVTGLNFVTVRVTLAVPGEFCTNSWSFLSSILCFAIAAARSWAIVAPPEVVAADVLPLVFICWVSSFWLLF